VRRKKSHSRGIGKCHKCTRAGKNFPWESYLGGGWGQKAALRVSPQLQTSSSPAKEGCIIVKRGERQKKNPVRMRLGLQKNQSQRGALSSLWEKENYRSRQGGQRSWKENSWNHDIGKGVHDFGRKRDSRPYMRGGRSRGGENHRLGGGKRSADHHS